RLLIAYDLIHSIEILGNTVKALDEKCLQGITAFPERCMDYAEGSLALVTALNTHIGYLNAAAIAKESLETGKPLRQLVLEHDLMDEATLNEVLDLQKMSCMMA
ncbi:MAG: aspartate ammonia-lyase, partial [Cyanobacteria bacterium J06555_13]